MDEIRIDESVRQEAVQDLSKTYPDTHQVLKDFINRSHTYKKEFNHDNN